MSEASGVPQPNPQAVQQIARLQQDGLLLLAHLAEKPDRYLVAEARPQDDQVDPGLLTAPAETIAVDAERFSSLLRTIDGLGRSAAPATTTTIRLTAAYLSGASDQASAEERRRARSLKYCLRFIRGLLLVAMLVSVGLLMHLDDGRRTVGQLATVRADLERTFGDMAKLDVATDWVTAWPNGDRDAVGAAPVPETVALQVPVPPRPGAAAAQPTAFIAYCEPDPPLPEEAARRRATAEAGTAPEPQEPYRVPAKAQAQNLCGLLYQQRLREAVVYAQLAAWNCRMALMMPQNALRAALGQPLDAPGTCVRAPVTLPPPAKGQDWERTELRTTNSIAMLAGYVLPLLLGCIGGCVYVLRRTDDKVKSWTLSANDGKAGIVRVTLAATFGGLLGLVFGTDAPVQLGGFSLSLAAWAFFLGYSLETVLKTLDALIESVVGKLRPPAEREKVVPIAPAR